MKRRDRSPKALGRSRAKSNFRIKYGLRERWVRPEEVVLYFLLLASQPRPVKHPAPFSKTRRGYERRQQRRLAR